MPANVYNRLLDLFAQDQGRPVNYGNAQDEQFFNNWTGGVATTLGATDWESLPENFESQYGAKQATNTLLSGDTLFNTVSKTTTDFFSTFTGGGAAPVTVAGSGTGPASSGPAAGTGTVIGPLNSPAPQTITPLTLAPGSSNPTGPYPTVTSVANPATDLLSNILTGNNGPQLTPSGGVNIISNTNAPTTSNFNYDQSTKTTVTVNQPELAKNILDGIKGFFGTAAAAAGSTPMNDAAFTKGALFPGSFSAGQTVNGPLSQPVSTDISSGTITGLPQGGAAMGSGRLFLILAVVGVLFAMLTFFRRGRS